MHHPYIVGNKIPNLGCDIDPDFSASGAIAMHIMHLDAVSKRNQKHLPVKVSEELSGPKKQDRTDFRSGAVLPGSCREVSDMCLFTSQTHRDAETGCRILELAARRFNDIPGSAYSVEIVSDRNAILRACETFRSIVSLGFPKNPGPFKRLAGVAVRCQHLRIASVAKNFADNADATEVLWNAWSPRFALWAVEFMAPLLKLDNGTQVPAFHLPTPHCQVEFFLRRRIPPPCPADAAVGGGAFE
jgi:hypothetical protein